MEAVGCAQVSRSPFCHCWLPPLGAQAPARPLEITLLPPPPSVDREFSYLLNDRAYVAMFVISPEHGVALLCPYDFDLAPDVIP